MSEFAIQVKHLDKMYKLYNKPSDRLRETLGLKVPVREHYALRDVSFDVKRGETVGIIGTNGSGKSTILKIITGIRSSCAEVESLHTLKFCLLKVRAITLGI